ncbi:MAG: ATP-binding protein [bacterium]
MEKQSYDTLIDHFKIIGETIASSSGVEHILKQIVESASQVLYADPVILFQFDKNKFRLIPPPIYAGKLFKETDYASSFVFKGGSFAERIITNGESLYLEQEEDISRHPSMGQRREDLVDGMRRGRFHEREQIKSMAALILKAEGETVGLMFLNYRTPQRFSGALKKLMETFASYAAIAITNSRLIEKLREKEAFLRKVVEKIPDPVFVTRNKIVEQALAWRIDVANQAAHKLFGYDFRLKSLENKDARELLAADLQRLEKAMQESGGTVSNFEINMSHKTGKAIPVSISTSVLERDDENHITKTICIAKDLTKRKELELQLEHLNSATLALLNAESLEEAYDTIFEHLSQIGYDKGMISLVDEANRTIVGQKAMGRNWQELVKKTTIPLHSIDVLARVVRSAEAAFIEDCTTNPYCNQEIIRQAGIKAQYIIPLIVQEKVTGILQIGLSDREDLLKGDKYILNETLNILAGFANQVAVAIETNKQKVAINKQQDAINRQKITIDELQTTLADIGHEFKSPLHNVSTQLGGLRYYLEKRYSNDERVRKIARIVQEEAFRADRQMKNALYSTGESLERMGVNFENDSISDTVSYCADRFRETAEKRGIKIIVYDSLKKLPGIYYDKSQMEQVFTNLIDNAVKYSYSKENIEIRGEDHGRKVEISVKDNGVGIPERLYEQIFEGFTRSDKLDPTRFIPGTGLGLKIAKKFVEKHNGKIFVRSKPFYVDPQKVMNYEGYTTTFFVILPKNPKEF